MKPLLVSKALVLATLTAAAASAQDSTHSTHNTLHLLPADELLSAELAMYADKIDAIEDAVVDMNDGKICTVICKTGQVLPFTALRYDYGAKQFGIATPASEKSGMKATARANALWPSGSRKLLLSKLLGMDLQGYARNDGKLEHTSIGSVGGAYIDLAKGEIAYITTSVGGVLGIGADSKALPFEAMRLQRTKSGDWTLSTSLTEKRLENAPKLEGGLKKLYNDTYRTSLDNYYNIERVDGEASAKSPEALSMMTTKQIVGAPVRCEKTGRADTVQDIWIDPSNGALVAVSLERGAVLPIGDVTWNCDARCFLCDMNNAVEKPSVATKKWIAQSTLSGCPMACSEKACGNCVDFYFDTKNKKIAYVSFDDDALRFLPWSTVSIASKNGERMLIAELPLAVVSSAPSADGTLTIYTPSLRERVDALASEQQDD